ncbi:MAG: type I methionyl aminopeptidase [Candidatus Fermentibacteraceae bacterium]
MALITSRSDVAAMREACRVVRKVLTEVGAFIEPGVTTADIDALGRRIIAAEGAVPSFLGYNGYPAGVCVSVNNEVVHGIPSTDRTIREGDLVSVDVGAFKGGFHGDAAETFPVGRVIPLASKLLEVTLRARDLGIAAAVNGGHVGDIGAAVQQEVEKNGFSVVRQLVGHGIGRRLHEKPQVPNYGSIGQGMRLSDGLLLAIEPMVNSGDALVKTLSDGWTVITADGSLSAHAEHTVMIRGREPEILTA